MLHIAHDAFTMENDATIRNSPTTFFTAGIIIPHFLLCDSPKS